MTRSSFDQRTNILFVVNQSDHVRSSILGRTLPNYLCTRRNTVASVQSASINYSLFFNEFGQENKMREHDRETSTESHHETTDSERNLIGQTDMQNGDVLAFPAEWGKTAFMLLYCLLCMFCMTVAIAIGTWPIFF